MNKLNSIKRVVAILLLIPIIMSIFSMPSYAVDTVYIESLIDMDNLSYTSNVITDTFSNNKKYEYKYFQMGGYLKNGCGNTSKSGIEGSQENPNYCYSLDDNINSAVKDSNGIPIWGSGTQLDFFLKSEGMFKSTGTSTLEIVEKKEDSLKLNSSHEFYSSSNKYSGAMMMEYPANPNSKNVTPAESNYAVEVANDLTASLNNILNIVNNGEKYSNIFELINTSIMIRPRTRTGNIAVVNSGSNDKGYVIIYADAADSASVYTTSEIGDAKKRLNDYFKNDTYTFTSSDGFFNQTKLPKANKDGDLIAYIFPLVNSSVQGLNVAGTFELGNYSTAQNSTTKMYLDFNQMSSVVYAKTKGYYAETGETPMFTDEDGNAYSFAKNDIPYITIHMVAQSANILYKKWGYTVSSMDHTEEQGILVKILTSIINAGVWALSSFLQLGDTNELIYNGGLRGASTYNYGVMSDSWWNIVLRYHLLFQVIAWFVIIVGFLKTLIGLNLSTINPAKRENVYESIKKFIVTGFLLVLIIPFVQFCFSFNNSIVKIFASQVDTDLTAAPAVAGIAGILISLMFLGIKIYINFVYIMRSITIALLVISAPFFISTLALSKRDTTQAFSSWLKELLANIFLQSVHAFTMAFLVNLLQSGSGLERIAVAVSIIPITEMFRGLILQGGAGATESLGKSAGEAWRGFATNAGRSFVGGSAGVAGALMTRNDTAEGGGSGIDNSEVGHQGSGGGARGGAAGNSGEAGFGSLNTAVNQKVKNLQGAAAKHAATGEKGKAFAAGLGAAGLAAGQGFANMMGTAMEMSSDMAAAQLTGNPAGFGSAGNRAGNLGASAVSHAGELKQDIADMKHEAEKFGADDTGLADNHINAIKGIDGVPATVENGQDVTVGSSALANAAARNDNSRASQIANKMLASQGLKQENGKVVADENATDVTRTQAQKYLESCGVYNVSNTGGNMKFTVGHAQGTATDIRQKNGKLVATHISEGNFRTVREGGQTAAIQSLTAEQAYNLKHTNAGFDRKYGHLISDTVSKDENGNNVYSFNRGESAENATFNGAKLDIRHDGLMANQSGTGAISQGYHHLYGNKDDVVRDTGNNNRNDNSIPSTNPQVQ